MQRTRSSSRLDAAVTLTATLLLGAACSAADEPAVAAAAGPATIVFDGAGLDRPVSIVYDPVADLYLVANAPAAGAPFIARVAPGGRPHTERWIGGAGAGVELNAPGGMVLRGDSLYVADRDCVRLFHRATGAAAGSVCPEGALALNGVAVDTRGRVYTSDAGTGVIHVIEGPTTRELLRDAALERSAGLAAGERGVFVASGGLYQLAPDGLRPVIGDRGDRLGGIIHTRDGSFAFSNPANSTVVYVEARGDGSHGAVWTLIRDVPSAGFLGYDARRERILIPATDEDRLLFVSLRP